MRDDTPTGFWPLRLLPTLAAVLGVAGLFVARGPMIGVAGLLLAAAAAVELLGWGSWVRTRARALGLATLAGACAGGIALTAVAAGGSSVVEPVIAQR
ncbi:MAG: hypothetical protein ACE37F_07820 [Nannocystaceae bacterium]|nr:hypothetical protein [bacterium]